jgi:hypothetical protein
MQLLNAGQLARLGPARPLGGVRLRRTGPIFRLGLPAATPLGAEPIPRPISPTAQPISVNFTHDRRRMTTQPIRNLADTLPPGHAVLDLVALVQRQPAPLPRGGRFIRKLRSHPASMSKPPLAGGHRHADSHPSFAGRHPLLDQIPELTTDTGQPRRTHQQLLS